MAYNSYFYVIFLLAAVFLYYILPRKIRWAQLLFVSVFYYLIASGKYFVFLFFSTVTVYLAGRGIEMVNLRFEAEKTKVPKEGRKGLKQTYTRYKQYITVAVVAVNVGLLVYRKYFAFLAATIDKVLEKLNIGAALPPLIFVLPLGISFYTLQALGYLIDVNRGKYPAERHFGKVALFLWFFPQMVEGPICRYDQTAQQLYTGHAFEYKNFMFGLQRFCWGMLKKVVVADRLDVLVNHIMANYKGYNGSFIVLVALAYTLQLYAEFSGCMDMVLGSSQLFGIRLPENFDHPFAAKSVQEYWRRWHITLGAWFKDYMFYAVNLSKPVKNFSKKLKAKKNNYYTKLSSTVIALFVVWSFTGLWHGASFRYLLYGWYYFVIIAAGVLFEPTALRLTEKLHINREGKAYTWFQRVRTFILINIGLLLFRTGSAEQFFHMFRSMFHEFRLKIFFDGTIYKLGLDRMDFLILAVMLLVIGLISMLQVRGVKIRESVAKLKLPLRWSLYLLLVVSTILFGAYGQGYATVAFIYANF